MEHRIGGRKQLHFDVLLIQNGKSIGRFTTKDVSLGGIGLQGYADRLTPNSLVTVCLLPDLGVATSLPELRAVVVHQADNSIGLMWTEHEVLRPSTMEQLRNNANQQASLTY